MSGFAVTHEEKLQAIKQNMRAANEKHAIPVPVKFTSPSGKVPCRYTIGILNSLKNYLLSFRHRSCNIKC